MLDLLHAFVDFARGGGGGSGGGGGGGGGGSGGSGGGGVIFVFGYVPAHFAAAIARRKLPRLAAHLIIWPLTALYVFVLLYAGVYGFLIGLGAILGSAAGLFNWFNRIAKLTGIAKKKQALAVAKDSAWDIAALQGIVTQTFMQYQKDWSEFNTVGMKAYLAPEYLQHNYLMMLALYQLGRRNSVDNPTITSLDLVDITDAIDNAEDRFIMLVTARANDKLYDNAGNVIYGDSQSFQEYWRFRRHETGWLLEGIGQATEDPYMRNNALAMFAQASGYFYSPDWGWLTLPARGQLFRGGKFGVSDINNHVVGKYHDTLIQLYNYIPNPQQSGSKNYLIAQVAVPKSYGNIVVRKRKTFQFAPRGLKRVSLEWGEFNQRYEIWASDLERVTSFELLNPSYMVKLYETPFEVNIEVVDNIIFLYSAKTKADSDHYQELLRLLYEAFEELRL